MLNSRILLPFFVLLLFQPASQVFAEVNASAFKPETTPPPAEGALMLKDLQAVFARRLPAHTANKADKEKPAPKKKEDDKIAMDDAEKQEMTPEQYLKSAEANQ